MTISCFPCGCHAIHISYNTHTNYIGSLIQTLFCSYCTLNWWYLKTHTVTHCAYTKWPWPTPLGGGFPCYLSAAFVGPVYSLAWHTFYLQRPFHWKAVVTEAWGALCVCVFVHVRACVCVCVPWWESQSTVIRTLSIFQFLLFLLFVFFLSNLPTILCSN